MATGKKVCKICGKEYECCQTNRRVEGVFRWQDVACCVEHGQEYLDQILKSRTEIAPAPAPAAEETEQIEKPETPVKKKSSRKKTEAQA